MTGANNSVILRFVLDAKKRIYLILFLLVTIPAAIYHAVCGFGFVSLDDSFHLAENPYVGEVSCDNLKNIFARPYKLYIPVTYALWSCVASYAVKSQSAESLQERYDPRIFHCVNLAIHILNILLVFLFVRVLVKNDWAACAGALFFGLHPLQIESFAWISEFKGLTAFFFMLSGITIVIASFKKTDTGLMRDESPARGSLGMRLSAATLLYLLALLSKPSVIIAPLILGICMYDTVARHKKSFYAIIALWCVMAVPVSLFTKSLQPTGVIHTAVSLWQRPLIVLDTITFYLQKLFFPFSLCCDYGRTPVKVLNNYPVFWVVIVSLAAAGIWFFFHRRMAYLTKSFLLFLAGIAAVSGIVPFLFQNYSTVADRYAYIAMLGPSLAVAALFSSPFSLPGLCLKTLGYVLVMGMFIFAGNSLLWTWQGSKNLYFQVLRVNPDSFLAYNNLASLYIKENKLPAAENLLQRALGLSSYFVNAHENLGLLYEKYGRYQDAVTHLTLALRSEEDRYAVRARLASAHEKLGHDSLALYYYHEAASCSENAAEAQNNIGLIYARKNLPDSAFYYYRRALSQNGRFWLALCNLGAEFMKTGRFADALRVLNKADQISPAEEPVLLNRGLVYLQLQDTALARSDFKKVLSVNKANQFAAKYLSEIENRK